MNLAIIVGRLGGDPETSYSESGTAITKMSVATNQNWKDNDGEWQERTEWHNITIFGKQGEACSNHLSKGSQVALRGRLSTSSWEDDNGNKRYRTEIIANKVDFLSGGGNGNNGEQGGDDESFDDDDIPF